MLRSAFWCWAILLALSSCGGAAPAGTTSAKQETPQTEPAKEQSLRVSATKDPRAFSTKDGLRIELLPLEPDPNSTFPSRALIRYTGAQGELDGVVLLANITEGGYSYATIRGTPRLLVYYSASSNPRHKNKTGWYYRRTLGDYGGTELSLADASTIDAEALMARYQAQEESGLNQKLAPRDMEARQRAQEAQLEEVLSNEDLQGCGRLAMRIDWSGVENAWFDSHGLASSCVRDLVVIDEFCKQYPHRVAKVQAALPMRCEFDGEPTRTGAVLPRLARDGRLVIRGANQSGFTEGLEPHVRKLFGESLQVLQGEKATFILRDEGRERVFYHGKGTTFYRVVDLTENSGGSAVEVGAGPNPAQVHRDDGLWTLHCGGAPEKLRPLDGAERDRVVKSAKFEKDRFWKRQPHYLGRDTRGVYYYVDRFHPIYGGKRYRVFTGRRGQLKISKLKAVVEDSEGTLFSTDAGELRLVISKKKAKATWIRGRRTLELTSVDVAMNSELIYDELGAYFGVDLGSPCAR